MSNYAVLYLGVVPNVSIMSTIDGAAGNQDQSTSANPMSGFRRADDPSVQVSPRSPDIQLIDRVDNAQLDGRIPYVGTNENQGVTLTVSKHGLKITEASSRGGNVIERVPLHTVAQAVSYNDGWGRWNVAVKTGQVGKNQFVCHVFQAQNETEAEGICQSIRDVFARVGTSE